MSDRDDRRIRLDQPREAGRGWRRQGRRRMDPETFGRFAEGFARFMGTATFIAWMTVFVAAWLFWNTLTPESLRFDPFPFIFLTLMLSLQASYAAPLILLAQNRQEARDRVTQEQDREQTARAHADMQFLAREVASLRLALGEVATRDFMRSELRGLVSDIEERLAGPEDEQADGQVDPTPR